MKPIPSVATVRPVGDLAPLLAKLTRVVPCGNGFYADCPACHRIGHLGLRLLRRRHKLVIGCVGGCHADDVLTAVGMDAADLHRQRIDTNILYRVQGTHTYRER